MRTKSSYTPEHGKLICDGLAAGRSLLSVCKEAGLSYEAAKNWERDIEEHRTNSLRAREIGCHAMAEQCLEIADDARNDWMETHGAGDVGYKVNGENIQRSRLRIDTRMRLLGKWLPKVYGEKVALTGEDGRPVFEKILVEVVKAK